MWISLTSSELWEFCRKQKIYLEESIGCSEYPNNLNAQMWVEIDERYSKLTKRYRGPIFLAHVEKVIPLTCEAKDSINQLLATFPNLIDYVRI